MIRLVLGFSLSGVTLALGAHTAFVQVENFEVAAELDRLADAAEWNVRRCSGIKPELKKFEFDLTAEQTRRLRDGAVSMRH